MNPDILFLFGGKPAAFSLYQQLEAQLLERYPDLRIKVAKTQVSFSNRYLFAAASLPRRKKEDHLIVTFGLGYQKYPRAFSPQPRPRADAGHTMLP